MGRLIGKLRPEIYLRYHSEGNVPKILPGPTKRITFIPAKNIQTSLDVVSEAESLFYFKLLELLDEDLSKREAEVAIIAEEESDRFVLSMKVEIAKNAIDRAELKIYRVRFSDPKAEPFVFQAQDDLAAIRAFLEIFGHLSYTITQKVLNDYGIEALERHYDDTWHVVYPGDDEYNARCRETENRFKHLDQ